MSLLGDMFLCVVPALHPSSHKEVLVSVRTFHERADLVYKSIINTIKPLKNTR